MYTKSALSVLSVCENFSNTLFFRTQHNASATNKKRGKKNEFSKCVVHNHKEFKLVSRTAFMCIERGRSYDTFHREQVRGGPAPHLVYGQLCLAMGPVDSPV